ncbi:alanine--glyoxylate aminotransferase family protein, partial [Streptomyces sp. NPDC003233]
AVLVSLAAVWRAGGVRPDAVIGHSQATTLRVPSGMLAAELVTHALADDPTLPVAAGGGTLPEEEIRVGHYGADAPPETVQRCLAALGTALGA